MSSIIDAVNAANSAGSSSSKTSSAAEMSDRFMTLFLAQLQNQDPLNPMENAEMTSQLAQMNMVSGLETLNESMQTLLGSYNEALSLQAANLVGKNVLVPGDDLTLSEDGSLFGLELSGPADKVEVIIMDSTGKEVARQSLGEQDAGSMAFYWDGTKSDGEKASAGSYSFSVSASLDGEPVEVKALQAGTVSALVRGTNGFLLEVAGLGNVTLDDVKQVF
ncbi:flagellar hook assembly protein FlgD [Azovibrio restrictus]|uniref:flagellar hook assembly protein FlgD n=1 Tax=Azovibrio restrictus TaxID=146938 RepID=UPI0003FA91FB|nr:flagellar hook assembly protein FlgD [Azovibrio restrictus]